MDDQWLALWKGMQYEDNGEFVAPGAGRIVELQSANPPPPAAVEEGNGESQPVATATTVTPPAPVLAEPTPTVTHTNLRSGLKASQSLNFRQLVSDAVLWQDAVTNSTVHVDLDRCEWSPVEKEVEATSDSSESDAAPTGVTQLVVGLPPSKLRLESGAPVDTERDIGLLPLDTVRYNEATKEVTLLKRSPLFDELHPCRLKQADRVAFNPSLDTKALHEALKQLTRRDPVAKLWDNNVFELDSSLLAMRILLGKIEVRLEAGVAVATYPTRESYTMVPHDDAVPFIEVKKGTWVPDPDVTYYVKLEEQRRKRWHGSVVMECKKTIPEGVREVEAMRGAVVDEAVLDTALRGKVDEENRLNLDGCFVFSIDGRGTMLYDDAFSVARKEEGFVVMVHIADPTGYVKESAVGVPQGTKGPPVEGKPLQVKDLDTVAKVKLGDVYHPDLANVDRMLPQDVLEVTSLCAGGQRDTLSVMLDIDKEGRVVGEEMLRTKIVNRVCFDMTDDMTWEDFTQHTQVLSPEECSPALKEEAIRHATTLHAAYLSASSHRACLEEVTQGREGPSAVVQHFMVLAKRAAAAKLSHFAPDLPCYTINNPPSATTLQKVKAAVNPVIEKLIGMRLDFESEGSLCRSLKVAKEYLLPLNYQGLLKHLQRSLGSRTPKAKWTPPHGDKWTRVAEVGFTSPLRRYSDLGVVRMLSRGVKEAWGGEVDEGMMRKKRLGQKLKRFNFAYGIFYKGGRRDELPMSNQCLLLAINPERQNRELTIFDGTIRDTFEIGLSSFSSHMIDTTGALCVMWSPTSSPEPLIPFTTTFSFLMTSSVGMQSGSFRFARKLLSREEEPHFPPLPLSLTTDSPDDWIEKCPF